MLRGTTARTLYGVLAAVLLALQLFAPTASVASAHPRTETAVAAEPAGCGEGKHLNAETAPLRVRDRQRSTDSAQETPARALVARDPATEHGDPAHTGAAASLRTTRSSRAHTPAVLQVFRC
ncbi:MULTISPECIES: hypothetical protein [Streptomyces]|jgi:hypothetical protein|uniref:hypothetical protein n=1 Tax=Streptomyces aurantiacus group TaxID=2838335 RepID=UPI000524C2EF|nr:hypothetical protein [Streptomyces yerevanensis]